MNTHILNRDFQHPADGWYQIEALGHHPHRATGVVQVIDAVAAESIVNRFNTEAAAGRLRHGHELLIDHEHFSDQPDQETRAYGWLRELQHRSDGIYGRIRWTSTGRAAVDGGDYRFFSTEYEPADLQPVKPAERMSMRMSREDDSRASSSSSSSLSSSSSHQVRPMRLAGLTLTNMNNNRGQKPITNRDQRAENRGQNPTSDIRPPTSSPFAGSGEPADSNPPALRFGAAGQTKTVVNKNMKTVCTLLGLSAEADEASVHAAVAKLLNRADLTPDDLTTLKNRASELEAANQTLLAEQLAGLLAEHQITDEKLKNRLMPVLTSLKNREERLACLADFGFKVGVQASACPPARILNRGTGSSAIAAAATADTNANDDAAIAQKIKNRANELHVNGRSFDSAWKQAMQEIQCKS